MKHLSRPLSQTLFTLIFSGVLLFYSCTPMKTVESEIYRPGDYIDAERETLATDLNSNLGEKLDKMTGSLEKIEDMLIIQEGSLDSLKIQYQILENNSKKSGSEKIDEIIKNKESNDSIEVKALIDSSIKNKDSIFEKDTIIKNDSMTKNEDSTDHLKNRDHGNVAEKICSKNKTETIINHHTLTNKNLQEPVNVINSNSISIPNDPETLYTKGRSLLLENNLDEAEKLFRHFSEKYPNHTLAINALYWTGECRYSLHDYNEAVVIFKNLVQKYPKGVKVPAALLKTAYAYLSMDDTDKAHHYLKSVIKQYPFSPAGEKAAQKLKSFQ